MRHFLFANVHCLWVYLHWMKVNDYYVHAWAAFFAFVLIGLVQTFLAVVSGKLAIPETLLRSKQRKKFLPFKVGGVIIGILFVVIGYLNDQNQYHADQKADRAINLTESWGRESHEFFAKFPNGAPPTVTTNLDQSIKDALDYHRQLEVLRGITQDAVALRAQLLSKAGTTSLPVQTPTPTPSNEVAAKPLSALSDSELRVSATVFYKYLHRVTIQLLDAQEQVEKIRFSMQQIHDPALQKRFNFTQGDVINSENNFAAASKNYSDLLQKIYEKDVPTAQEYRQVLLARLGPRATPPADFPDVQKDFRSLVTFLYAARNRIENWTDQLPTN
jgi:hypothetical protein